MFVSRNALFAICLCVVTFPFLIPKLVWLSNAKKTTGTMRFVGKSYTGQLIHFYSEISFPAGGDTIWFDSKDNTIFAIGESVPVLYQKNDPQDARVNLFSNVWSDTVIYGSGPLLILLFVFFHPRGIPRNFRIYLRTRRKARALAR